MKTGSIKFFHVLAGVALVSVLSAQSALAQADDSNARHLEGTWIVTVTPNNCHGTPIATSFPALLTFALWYGHGDRNAIVYPS